jgi:TetR/AcrR family transcriptional regulator, tetracycline repressor protein
MAERLDRERVVRAALALLDEVGLDGLTLRRLAQELGVKAPALYWHVASKADLLHEMAATMLRDLVDGDTWDEAAIAPSSWRQCVLDSADALRRTLLAHRDGARVLSSTTVTDESLRGAIEAPLGILTAAGFTPDDAARAWGTVLSYVLGFVLEEQGPGGARGSVGLDGEGSGRPACAGDGRVDLGDVDERFAFGAEVIVEGLAARLA